MTRTFVDAIFEHIGAESVTDDEFATLSVDLVDEYTKETYIALRDLLSAREAVSQFLKRLKLYYCSMGISLADVPSYTPRSNIFIGVPLDD